MTINLPGGLPPVVLPQKSIASIGTELATMLDPSFFASTKAYAEKSEHGEKVYTLLREAALANGGVLPTELRPHFYQLCQHFAASVLYNQKTAEKHGGVSTEEGFRRCALLGELSLLMQLSDHGLATPIPLNWSEATSLRKLLDDPHHDVTANVKKTIIQHDPSIAVAHFSNEERELFYLTIFRLSWAQQNLPALKTGDEIPVHDRFSKWSVVFNGPDEGRLLVYLYNRVYVQCFGLESADKRLEKLVKAYDDILVEGAKYCNTTGVPYRQITGQVNNMKAVLHYRAGYHYTKWLPYSQEALEIYNQLIEEVTAQGNTTEAAEKLTTLRNLRGNCLTGLVTGLCSQLEREKPAAGSPLHAELQQAADILRAHTSECQRFGFSNDYVDSYIMSLALAEVALKAL